MTVPAAPRPPAAATVPPRHLALLVWAVAAAVIVQAGLAGLFLSGVAGARLVHTIVGWLLPWAAVAVAVVVAVAHRRGACPPRLARAVYPLPVLLWIQEVLGHVPAPVTTAIHVPLGVALAVHAAVVASLLTAARPRADSPGHVGGRPTHRRDGTRMRTVVAVGVGLVVGALAGVAVNQVLGLAGLVLLGEVHQLRGLRFVPALTALIGAATAVALTRRRSDRRGG